MGGNMRIVILSIWTTFACGLRSCDAIELTPKRENKIFARNGFKDTIDHSMQKGCWSQCVAMRQLSRARAMPCFQSFLIGLILLPVCIINALNNGLALIPPMGFNSWEWFRCEVDCARFPDDCVSDKLYRQIADAMVANGMKAVGYTYINIDDCWSLHERDPGTHRLVPDPRRFPNGISGLSAYVHARGLKLGLYGDVGTKTCAGYPGSKDYERVDAETFAEWGVDYIKMDGCNIDSRDLYDAFASFGEAASHTAHPMVYSCGAYYILRDSPTMDLGRLRQYCNSWRNYEDVGRHIDSVSSKWYWDRPTWHSSIRHVISYFLRENAAMMPFHGAGGWNDPDMMSIGTPQMDQPSYARTQFALWSLLAAPLLVSSDLRILSRDALSILLNRDIIAINQDRLGLMAYVKNLGTEDGMDETDLVLLIKPIEPIVTVDNVDYHSYAFMLINFNTGTVPQKFNVQLNDFGTEYFANPAGYVVKELYSQQEFGTLRPDDGLNFAVAPNDDCVVFRAIAQQKSSKWYNIWSKEKTGF